MYSCLVNIGYLIACVDILLDEDDDIEIEQFYDVIKKYKEEHFG